MTTGRADVDHVLDAIDGAIGDVTMPDAMRWVPEEARDEPAPAGERPLPGMDDPPPARRHWLRERYLVQRADGTEVARGRATATPSWPGSEHLSGRLFRESSVDSVLDWLPLARRGLGVIAVLAPASQDFDAWCNSRNLPRDDRQRHVVCVADPLRDVPRLRGAEVLAAVVLDGFEDLPSGDDLLRMFMAEVRVRMRPLDPAELRRAAVAAVREAVERYGPHAPQSPSWPGGALRQLRAQQFARPWEPDPAPEDGEARVPGLPEAMARRTREEAANCAPADCQLCATAGRPCAYHRGPRWWIGGREVPGVRGVSFSRAIVDEAVTFNTEPHVPGVAERTAQVIRDAGWYQLAAGGHRAGRTSALREAVRGVPHAWVGRDGAVTYPHVTPPDGLVTIAGHCWCGTRVDQIRSWVGRFEQDGPIHPPPSMRLEPCGHGAAYFHTSQAGGRRRMWFHPRPRSCQ